MTLQPITIREAQAFVALHHRHHRAPAGGLFAIGLNDGEQIIGVVIVGRPVSRHLADGWTAEVTRLCVLDGYPNACSRLYQAGKRAAQALGYRRVITYILVRESGASLKGAGWKYVRNTEDARGWNRPKRHRVDTHPLEQKQLWEAQA